MKTYEECARLFATARYPERGKPISHNQRLFYNEREDCYMHQHHRTITVKIFRDKYEIDTGGWDTVTTWAKIHEFANVHFTGRPTPAYVASKFVVWHQDGKRCLTEFYDGIQVDLNGVPLDPQPVEVRKAIRGACKEFYDTAKKVRAAVAVRMLVGEFDSVEDVTPLGEREMWEHVQEVAELAEKDEFIPTEILLPLFAQREMLSFGNRRHYGRWGNYEQKVSPAKTRLNTSLCVAKRGWEYTTRRSDRHEIIKRSFT